MKRVAFFQAVSCISPAVRHTSRIMKSSSSCFTSARPSAMRSVRTSNARIEELSARWLALALAASFATLAQAGPVQKLQQGKQAASQPEYACGGPVEKATWQLWDQSGKAFF